MNKLILAVGLPFVAIFVFVYALFSVTPRPVTVDAYNLRTPEFQACVADPTADGQVILTAPNVAGCGQSVSLMVDGNVINGVVDGVLVNESWSTIQVGFIRDGKPVTALTSNQAADVIVR